MPGMERLLFPHVVSETAWLTSPSQTHICAAVAWNISWWGCEWPQILPVWRASGWLGEANYLLAGSSVAPSLLLWKEILEACALLNLLQGGCQKTQAGDYCCLYRQQFPPLLVEHVLCVSTVAAGSGEPIAIFPIMRTISALFSFHYRNLRGLEHTGSHSPTL